MTANELIGALQGFYGIGAAIGPLVVGALVTKYHWPWYRFYHIMTGLAAFELIATTSMFWTETGAKFHENVSPHSVHGGPLKMALRNKVTWTCSAIIFAAVGLEGKDPPFLRIIRLTEGCYL